MFIKSITINILNKFKYFGFRFLYYRFIQTKFPFAYERFLAFVNPTLTSKYLSRKLIKTYYGWIGQGADPKLGDLGLGTIHYGVIRAVKPTRILCIGSYRGFIPAICALTSQENGRGIVDFVDAGKDYGKGNLLGDGFWKKINPSKHFGQIVDSKYIRTYIMTSQEFVNRYPKRRYMYIHIDGDHTYKGVKEDYKLFWPRLQKGGLMSFHDILGEGYGGIKFGVKKFWDELPVRNKINFKYPLESGLGIIQKIT